MKEIEKIRKGKVKRIHRPWKVKEGLEKNKRNKEWKNNPGPTKLKWKNWNWNSKRITNHQLTEEEKI